MGRNSSSGGERCFRAGLWGSIIAVICCFTPALVIALGFLGLAALTPYLDYILFPLLAGFLISGALRLVEDKRTEMMGAQSGHSCAGDRAGGRQPSQAACWSTKWKERLPFIQLPAELHVMRRKSFFRITRSRLLIAT